MAYVIAEPCIDVKDKACVDECPVDCIYEGPRMLYIQPDECVDCDACVPRVPRHRDLHRTRTSRASGSSSRRSTPSGSSKPDGLGHAGGRAGGSAGKDHTRSSPSGRPVA
jgi:NAD-dependent dihydropyrimidine dehydrogenase PreA subunit